MIHAYTYDPAQMLREYTIRINIIDSDLIFFFKQKTAYEIFVARDGRLLGAIAVADTVRPEARRAVEALARKGLRIILLTGDTKAVAVAVARSLGIGETEPTLFPGDKQPPIQRLAPRGLLV